MRAERETGANCGPGEAAVAYFSMEIAVSADIPTYSGGLGVLAGDTLRAAADMGLPMVGVTLLYRDGYFRQVLDEQGNQIEEPVRWSPEDLLELLPVQAEITLEGRTVRVQAWRLELRGVTGHAVPVIFLDTDIPGNSEFDRDLTDDLYGGDAHYRLCQEAVLGLGGVAILEQLQPDAPRVYHLNEGHSALLTLGLLRRARGGASGPPTEDQIEQVRAQCVFTTHTPVPAGHDRFDWDLVRRVLGPDDVELLRQTDCCNGDSELNMTYLALRFARYVNGVALRHGAISSGMFPGYPIRSITNGVHVLTWTCDAFAELFDRHIHTWRLDNEMLRYAIGIPLEEIQQAHSRAKQALLHEVEQRMGLRLRENALTLGFARRATAYKRGDLLFSDLERLRALGQEHEGLQVIYSGKAHPADESGDEIIRRVFEAAGELAPDVTVVYLENYDMRLARLICSGVDVWLNTPLKPHEASGTSGMKCALNGVPSLSVLDGWWLEGHIENVTGWAIGDAAPGDGDEERERESLYHKLQDVIAPLYYRRPAAFAEVMRHAIALNGSFFNAQRMLSQYRSNAYQSAEAALAPQAVQPQAAH